MKYFIGILNKEKKYIYIYTLLNFRLLKSPIWFIRSHLIYVASSIIHKLNAEEMMVIFIYLSIYFSFNISICNKICSYLEESYSPGSLTAECVLYFFSVNLS